MNINKKYIIIFGALILLLVIITGGITYYNERTSQTKILDVKQDVLNFSQDYPTNLKELSDFLIFCHDAPFSDIEGLKDKEIKEVVCTIERDVRKILLNEKTRLVNDYSPLISPLDSISSFKVGSYIVISVDLKDVLRKYDASILEEEKLYFCSVSEPSWADPFSSQMKKPRQTMIFDEGDVSCTGQNMDPILVMYFYGFVPKAESINIKHYLVDEQTVSDVMNNQSFSEIKDILSNYPIIWQMEKQITP